jgi:ABC-type transport system involved in multi-copper enzyme maturation permease subunit
VLVPPASLLLLLLLQLPRIVHVVSLFDKPAGDWRATASLAELVEAFYSNCVVLGAIFSVVLGASSTGRRRVRQQIAAILARPLSRSEFVIGRLIGLGMVLGVFWLIPAVAFEVIRWVVGSSVSLHPLAYLVPFALHLVLLAMGMATGTVLRTIPAVSVSVACCWAVLFLRSSSESSSRVWQSVSAVSRWVVPPLADLVQAAAPFASPAATSIDVVLLVQSAAWIGLFVVAASWSYERGDFGSRSS